jgi:flagellar biosynthesis component FlhA
VNAVIERLNLGHTPWKALAAPILIMMILGMMILPLPAFALDRLMNRAIPRLKVLGHGEIPDFSAIQVSIVVGAQA